MNHTIELKKVSKYYAGADSVSLGFSCVDLNLDMGEFVAITGESGSGKSTLLNIISGLDTYDEGEMFVCGEDTSGFVTQDYEDYRKKYIGNIFQDFNLINSYTVYQNIEAVMLLCGKKKRECREKIKELISLVGLEKYTKTKASKLSGGQKQRVAIARALAKDAPIIVADEPTGNLDSESAAIVMQTLAKVSADRLVVIVTHNYEQAEPYVTRKITMHDGRIIENRETGVEARVARRSRTTERKTDFKNMGFGSELRLGVRNTFNLPTKFILLFLVYLFLSTSVISQYASTNASLHQRVMIGYNEYFQNTQPERVVLTKKDNSPITEQDLEPIRKLKNVKDVVPRDIIIDKGMGFDLPDMYVEGNVYPVDMIKDKKLDYGHMPEADNEIVFTANEMSGTADLVKEKGESLIGKEIKINDLMMNSYQIGKKVKIAGIIVEDEDSNNSISFSQFGYSKIYVTDYIGKKMMIDTMASFSNTVINYNGNKVGLGSDSTNKKIYASDRVPKDKAYIMEDAANYYKDGKAVGKNVEISIKNRYFSDNKKLEVGKIVTKKNSKAELGISGDEFESNCFECIFINSKVYNELYDRDNYQVSVFMDNENKSEELEATLDEMGYKTLFLKDTLRGEEDVFMAVIKMANYVMMAVMFAIAFFIAYAVIKLIMKSRSSVYSTLRILGATKRNTDNILRVELILMMIIAYIVDIAFVLLVKKGYIDNHWIVKILEFIEIKHFVILGAVLMFMSLMLANRYSRKIFKKSAMKTFREEV